LGAFILRAFGINRCQKEGLKKKTQKNSEHRGAVYTVKTDSGAVGPFKPKKRNIIFPEN
jgi:hypothetical protein